MHSSRKNSVRIFCASILAFVCSGTIPAQTKETIPILLIAGSKLQQDAPVVIRIQPNSDPQVTVIVDESKVTATDLSAAVEMVRQLRVQYKGVYPGDLLVVPKAREGAKQADASLDGAAVAQLKQLTNSKPIGVNGKPPAKTVLMFVDAKPTGKTLKMP